MGKRIKIFHPGLFLKEELAARGITQHAFAKKAGTHPRVISEIINAKQAISPKIAVKIAKVLGTSAMLWLNHESEWQLYKLSRLSRMGSDGTF